MLTDLFSSLTACPDDPILAVAQAFQQDARPHKVNLSVGVYLDENGRLPLLRAVEQAEKRLCAQGSAHGYGPMEGNPDYCREIKRLVFGADEGLLSRIHTVQTVGGTGALQLGAAFARQTLNITHAAASNPTWGNHIAILRSAGMTVARYPYYDAETLSIDRDAFFAGLEALPERTLVILHACCHNPTGVDLSDDDWNRVIEVMKAKNLLPFIDMAYQGFGDGLEEDARTLRKFAASGMSVLAATSSSKNFGLYGERVGALHVIASNASECAVIRTILNAIIRAEYSNPPRHGGEIVATVLGDPELRALWEQEVRACRDRMLRMRRSLAEHGHALGVDLDFAVRQKGMFSLTGFTPDEMRRLREEFSVYGVDNGRICIAGLNEGNVAAVARAFAQILNDRRH